MEIGQTTLPGKCHRSQSDDFSVYDHVLADFDIARLAIYPSLCCSYE